MEKRWTKIRTTRKPATRKASTRDILKGSAPRTDVPRKWARQHRRLLELRDHFTNERRVLSENAREARPQFSEHIADAGTDAYDRDWALGMLSSEQDALFQIEQALDRIRHGTYGVCELTGRKISRERLEAIPWTRFSAEAVRQLEREGRVDRTGLGARERVPRRETANDIGEEQG